MSTNHLLSAHLLPLNVGLARHNADWNWQSVRSPFARLYLVTEGHAEVWLDTDAGRLQLNLQAGHLYLIPAFCVHGYACTGPFTHYYIHIYETEEEVLSLHLPYEVAAEPVDLALMRRLCQILPDFRLKSSNPNTYDNHVTLVENIRRYHNRTDAERSETHGILQILLSRFMRNAQPDVKVSDNRIAASLHYIRHHLGEEIRLDRLAADACMSKDHFIRSFRHATGETPAAYIVRRRMERAEVLLVTTDDPIKNIAARLAYDDVAYFIRIFRQKVGMTPAAYRITSASGRRSRESRPASPD